MANFNRELGMVATDDGVELETRPEHEVMPGTIHFAVLATLAEVSAAQAANRSVVPTNVHLNLMRRAVPGKLLAKGRVLKAGRTLVFAEGEVFQDDKLIAKATVTFAVIA